MVGVRIPFAALLHPDAWARTRSGGAFPLGTITSATLTALYYRFGGWRRARMLDESRAARRPTPAWPPRPSVVPPDADEAAAAVGAGAPRTGGLSALPRRGASAL